MRFNSNQAWKDGAAAVAANRDLLLALAGVFLVLPSLALAVFAPPPEPPTGATFESSMALTGQYYTAAWPGLLVVLVASMIGTLAMLALFTDRNRPTVGQAIRIGGAAFPVLLVAQFGAAIVAALVLGPLLALGKASGMPLVALATMLVAVGTVAIGAIRLSLVAPVIVVEQLRNPLDALKRSWSLTRGQFWRLAAFYLLLLIAFMIATRLIAMALGLIVAMVASGATALTINALIESILSSVITIYFIAIAATTHRQLAGGSVVSVEQRFE